MFRFTIRDVLWLTVLVAVLAGWFVDHGRLTRFRLAVVQQLAVSESERGTWERRAITDAKEFSKLKAAILDRGWTWVGKDGGLVVEPTPAAHDPN